MSSQDFLYRLVLLLHLASVVVGFGSAFVYPMLTSRAQGLSLREAYAVTHSTLLPSRALTAYPIVASGVFGFLLVLLGGETAGLKFSQSWISIAFLLFLAAVGVTFFLVQPNLKAMDALSARLAEGNITPSKSGGEPKEAIELKERGAKAASFAGLMHLLWLLLMIDMIWQPGRYS